MLKPSESPVKILLADDSVTMHRAVALALKKLPWQLVTCDNGQDALRLALEQRPDVVIADLDMPGMTGAELCQTLRAKPGLSHTKLILLCGSFDQVDESRLEQIPADGRLWKPFESHVLTALIDALLKNASAKESADPTGAIPREAMEKTLPPAGGSTTDPRVTGEKTAPPASTSGDLAREMTAETFRPSPASTIKERILPIPDISPEKAMENLWSPDLNFDETLPPVAPTTSTAASESPTSAEATSYPSPQPEETEFSVFRGAPSVPLEEEALPETPLSSEEFVMEPTPAQSRRPLPDLESMAEKWDAGARPMAGIDEDTLRKIVKEEIQSAFEGRLKAELEKTLAQVIEEIDRT